LFTVVFVSAPVVFVAADFIVAVTVSAADGYKYGVVGEGRTGKGLEIQTNSVAYSPQATLPTE
jgi:hypothetical protein